MEKQRDGETEWRGGGGGRGRRTEGMMDTNTERRRDGNSWWADFFFTKSESKNAETPGSYVLIQQISLIDFGNPDFFVGYLNNPSVGSIIVKPYRMKEMGKQWAVVNVAWVTDLMYPW